MRVFCLCVYSLYFAGLLWVSLGLMLLSLGRLWASFLEPLGCLELSKVPLGVTLVSLWLPWDAMGPFGAPWAPKWTWDDLGSKMDVLFRANGRQVAHLRIKSDLPEFSGGSAQWAQSGDGAAAPNSTSLGSGARMTVV